MTRLASRVLPYAAVASAACAWGTWALVIRHTEAMGPMPTALESTVVMVVLTLVSGLASLRDRVPRRASWKARGWVVWLGVADALNVLLFFAAYKITIAPAVLAHYLTPILVALAAPLLLREKLTTTTLLAVVLSFAGLATMLAPSGGGAANAALWTSAALGAGSAVFYASNVVINKFVADAFSTSETMFWHGVVAAPFLAAFVPWKAWSEVDAHALTFLAVASIGPGALAAMAFVWGLRRMPAAHASTLTLLEPLVAIGLGAAVLNEAMGTRGVAGGVLILTGSLLVIAQARPMSQAALPARSPHRGT